ncbi:hypothetical protein B0H17DRAFT_1074434 [Mycena rosella]|uniref:Uncharacterized protein n=1 Tax=Mycena rosella TaxID=1033263 RepID=A0AAD7DAZ8_MYCRO|nr:hypothetical protein B0H17DRAFT_1074434 [Mycena rosella]
MPKQPRNPPGHPVKGYPLRLYKASRRSLESWANHYGFKHLADELPRNERAAFYRARLEEIQHQGKGPFYGQPMKRLAMSESDWPNRKYRAGAREIYEPKLRKGRKKKTEKRSSASIEDLKCAEGGGP